MSTTEHTGSDGHDQGYGLADVDDENQLTGEDTLGDGSGSDVVDELDRGYSPPEHYSAGQGYGNTPYEEATGESFAQRLAQEVPDVDAADDPEPDGENAPEESDEREVGDRRSGRLVAVDDGVEQDLVGTDVGIDGAAASAEEAAMHVVPDEDEPRWTER